MNLQLDHRRLKRARDFPQTSEMRFSHFLTREWEVRFDPVNVPVEMSGRVDVTDGCSFGA